MTLLGPVAPGPGPGPANASGGLSGTGTPSPHESVGPGRGRDRARARRPRVVKLAPASGSLSLGPSRWSRPGPPAFGRPLAPTATASLAKAPTRSPSAASWYQCSARQRRQINPRFQSKGTLGRQLAAQVREPEEDQTSLAGRQLARGRPGPGLSTKFYYSAGRPTPLPRDCCSLSCSISFVQASSRNWFLSISASSFSVRSTSFEFPSDMTCRPKAIAQFERPG